MEQPARSTSFGANVRFWADISRQGRDVRFWGVKRTSARRQVMSAYDPKRTKAGLKSRSAADLLGASVCATVGDGRTGVPMFAELHVPMTGQADRDDGCGTSGRSEPEPSRSRLEAVRQAVGEIPRWGVSTEKASKRSKKMDFI